MSLSAAEVKKIAKLSRIRLEEQEIEHFQQELSQILDWAEMLQEVDTNNVPQMFSASDESLPLRKDVANDGGYSEEILKNAPNSDYNCFLVPKVIE